MCGNLVNQKTFAKIAKYLCYATLVVGVYLVYTLFFGKYDLVSGAVGMISGQSSGFLMFFYTAVTILLLKLKDKEKGPKSYLVVMTVGFFIAFAFSMPILLTPVSTSQAEGEFEQTFGQDWEESIPNDVEEHYRETQFILPQYFLGKANADCEVKQDVLYYENEGVQLYFDVYMPEESKGNLPGNQSTIIKIHGGGWCFGDKGAGSMIPSSKYLASQGYVVFDIQYGLRKSVNLMNFIEFEYNGGLLAESHVMGNFTVPDQVRQIGVFSKKLVDEFADDYDANLNNVYIMGGSAGGHLTSVFGLGYNENYFDSTFGENLNIKGIIPIYPAVDAELYFHEYLPELLEGTPKTNPDLFKYYDPSELVDANDPPALIFQGTSDGLARPRQSKILEDEMEDKELKCCRLLFPLAGHASNFLYNSNHNQVWIYYLERFLYLTR